MNIQEDIGVPHWLSRRRSSDYHPLSVTLQLNSPGLQATLSSADPSALELPLCSAVAPLVCFSAQPL